MGGMADPQHASIDSLIGWLREQRRRDPCSPLSSLLAGKKFDQRRIVDIACIDLMERRRMGHAVTVESYVEDFSCIQDESNLLDLIDAEICVASELGEQPQLDDYAGRFPQLADQVMELVRLDAAAESEMTAALVDVSGEAQNVSDQNVSDSDQNVSDRAQNVSDRDQNVVMATNVAQAPASQSADFSIDVLPSDATPTKAEAATRHPIDLPAWFVGEQCVASGPGRWLIRGRDSVRGINLALKVTELPPRLTKVQGEQILDACEMAAKVRNASWVLPSVAAIQQRHLGVIRPWIYARPWQQLRATQDHRTQLRNLASVAFAVASAHQVGATHGGIHVENLMVGHDGKVQILDAAASRVGLERWLSPTSGSCDLEQILSLDQRISVDVQDLIKLVAAASVDWDQKWAIDLLANLRRIATSRAREACALIGQELVQHADSQNPAIEKAGQRQQRSWRIRLARWLTNSD
jgi:hypothetical protein